MSSPAASEAVIAATRDWLERAVIGLDLCPFARPVHLQGRIRYAVSEATTPAALLGEVLDEMLRLAGCEPGEIETTLVIHPRVLGDFGDYNDFLAVAESALADLGLGSVLQIASFHPAYQFAGTAPEDIENYTNRSPYPILHLLRQASVERAVAAFPDPAAIFAKNKETLRRLGHAGWRRLRIGGRPLRKPVS